MSREIDALVAEKAFGWVGLYRMNNVHGVAGWPDITKKSYMAPEVVPKYSTDPAASKRLRDRMRELGWNWNISSPLMGSEYVVQFVKHNAAYRPRFFMDHEGNLHDASTDVSVFHGKAESSVEETATALAALRAVESTPDRSESATQAQPHDPESTA